MKRSLDPFGAWEHLPEGWTFCPDCNLPTGNVKEHRKAKGCIAINVITRQWEIGRVMLPLSLNIPGSVSGRSLPEAKSAQLANRRRFAASPLPDAALWDVLLLAAASEGLSPSAPQPQTPAIRRAITHVLERGRPTLNSQPYLHTFTIYCHEEGTRSVPRSFDHHNEWHVHTLERDEATGLHALSHTGNTRIDEFLATLSEQRPDCLRLTSWWHEPDHRYRDPVPYKALWRDVDRYNAWRETDVEPWTVDAWMQVSAGPTEAEAWTRAGYTPWEAYLSTLYHVYPDNKSGNPFGRPEDWRAAGFDVLEARKWAGVSTQAVRPFLDIRGSEYSSAQVERPFSPAVAQNHRQRHITYSAALRDCADTQHIPVVTETDKVYGNWCANFMAAQQTCSTACVT